MKTIRIILSIVLLALVFLFWVQQRSGQPMERVGVPMNGKVEKTDVRWRELLTDEQFRITRRHGTERAFTGEYWNHKEPGVYQCVCCGQPLFDSDAKYDSGTGWPSFWKPMDDNYLSLHADNSWFVKRTEVTCSRCDAHLGHVFNDGPAPTGLRYCINSAALKFVAREAAKPPPGGVSEQKP